MISTSQLAAFLGHFTEDPRKITDEEARGSLQTLETLLCVVDFEPVSGAEEDITRYLSAIDGGVGEETQKAAMRLAVLFAQGSAGRIKAAA